MQEEEYIGISSKCDYSISQTFLTYFEFESAANDFITKCDRQLLQSASATTKCYRLYYKVRQVLQSVTQTTPSNICTTFTFMTQGTKFLFIVISSARSKYTVCITLHISNKLYHFSIYYGGFSIHFSKTWVLYNQFQYFQKLYNNWNEKI